MLPLPSIIICVTVAIQQNEQLEVLGNQFGTGSMRAFDSDLLISIAIGQINMRNGWQIVLEQELNTNNIRAKTRKHKQGET